MLTDVVPVPGAASINELIIGPDGNLWGLADGIVFVANPTTGAVLRQIPVFSGRTGANDGALSWRDGYLYGVTGGRLFVADSPGRVDHAARPRSQPVTRPRRHVLHAAATGRLDDLTNLASVHRTVDPCPAVGPPGDGGTGNINSHVMNRHVEYGCTLTDRSRMPRQSGRATPPTSSRSTRRSGN